MKKFAITINWLDGENNIWEMPFESMSEAQNWATLYHGSLAVSEVEEIKTNYISITETKIGNAVVTTAYISLFEPVSKGKKVVAIVNENPLGYEGKIKNSDLEWLFKYYVKTPCPEVGRRFV